jgi:hypothetical protein
MMRPPLGVSMISSRELHFGHFNLTRASIEGKHDDTARLSPIKGIPN